MNAAPRCDAPHGLNTTYQAGCRCAECRAAHAKTARDDLLRRKREARARIARTVMLIRAYYA